MTDGLPKPYYSHAGVTVYHPIKRYAQDVLPLAS